MTMPVIKLSDIVDALQIQSETITHYLSKKTGKIVQINKEDADAAENNEIREEFPEWQQEDIKLAREVWGGNHYIPLPTRFDIHEYEIMVNFCLSIRNKEVSRNLYDLTRGRGVSYTKILPGGGFFVIMPIFCLGRLKDQIDDRLKKLQWLIKRMNRL